MYWRNLGDPIIALSGQNLFRSTILERVFLCVRNMRRITNSPFYEAAIYSIAWQRKEQPYLFYNMLNW